MEGKMGWVLITWDDVILFDEEAEAHAYLETRDHLPFKPFSPIANHGQSRQDVLLCLTKGGQAHKIGQLRRVTGVGAKATNGDIDP
jgi:hypothetical protein